ncbi:MAG TPA: TIGR03067 domain-containing protein [Gemmatales bacterium]|nr:TIGR03067 domain-containing protein [Gemmatales bacterium]HMP58714.1 TIGR03067 domain-containing protein [Gemmatales bacterium]
MKTAWMGMLFLVLSAAGQTPDSNDLNLLQGRWTASSIEVQGRRLIQSEVEKLQFLFEAKGSQVTFGPADMRREATLRLDGSRTPRTIDFRLKAEADKPQVTLLGIYKIEGDTLTLCVPANPDIPARPTEFRSDPAAGTTLVVLQRVKPDAPPQR